MTATPREIVLRSLNFDSPPRAPRHLWLLLWAELNYPAELKRIRERFPSDIVNLGADYREPSNTQGDPCLTGTYVDPWGCVFTNLQDGIIGEVREPLIRKWSEGWSHVHFPREWFSFDVDDVNRKVGEQDRFTISGACAQPFERMQFLRTTELFYIDLLEQPDEMLKFLKQLHGFYCELLEKWGRTDVDALMIGDDWGSQHSLLINPELWRELYLPMYRDYIDIAHAAGKKAFFHSDGYILDIVPDLVEAGLDALNSQLFCMGVENLAPFAGRLTFWGEIDRQHILPYGTKEIVENAVRDVHRHLWKNGGCIAQCEFGIGAKPENVELVFETWDSITAPEVLK